MIVTVARHHMPRTADIDVIGVRYELEKFFGMRLLHELGGCAAHQQSGDLDPARGLDQRRFERTAVRSGRARTIEEARIPVPTPAAIGRQAEILLQSLIALRPRPLRKIIGDRLRGLGDRREILPWHVRA